MLIASPPRLEHSRHERCPAWPGPGRRAQLDVRSHTRTLAAPGTPRSQEPEPSQLQQLVRWKPQPFLIEVDGQRYGATFTVLANAASYGGGLRIAPRASLDSEYLDLCLFDWTDRRRFVRHLRAGMGGRHLGLPGVTYVQAKRAEASGPGVWVQVDGELLGDLPMTFECVPATLSLIVP